MSSSLYAHEHEQNPLIPPRRRGDWPDAVAYQEALQNPATHIGDQELSQARVATGRGGLPLAYSGRFAVVFRLEMPDGTSWALRCFTSPDQIAERFLHWQGVAGYAEALTPALVPVRCLEKGVLVGGRWYSAVAMPWVEGEPLLAFVERNRHRPEALRRLAASLDRLLLRLEDFGVAHGDWQHDNMFVADDGRSVTLVDYDGFFAPEWSGGAHAAEVGHPNYQHPGRRPEHFGVGLDRFACASLRTALLALAREPALLDRFSDGESLVFTRADFVAPDTSPAFATVRALAASGDEDLREALDALEAACREPGPRLSPAAPSIAPVPEVGRWAREAPHRAAAAPRSAIPPLGAGRRRARVRTDGNAPGALSLLRPRPYRARLALEVAAGRERRNLGGVRRYLAAGALVLTLAVWGLGWTFLTGLLFASFGYWFLTGFYLNWPRKRLADLLHEEMGRLHYEVLACEAQRRAARLRLRMVGAAEATGDSSAPGLVEAARARLRQIPVSRALALPGVRRDAVRALRRGGVETAADVLAHPEGGLEALPGGGRGAAAQEARLRLWGRELLAFHEEEQRRLLSPRLALKAEIEALERGIAARHARMRELRDEWRDYPDASLTAYLWRALHRADPVEDSAGSDGTSGGSAL
jgi:RIO-like serine/threonine protein kinase fused to N-terminal HTH domain